MLTHSTGHLQGGRNATASSCSLTNDHDAPPEIVFQGPQPPRSAQTKQKMDILGELGTDDQLVSGELPAKGLAMNGESRTITPAKHVTNRECHVKARAEIGVLAAKVKELSFQVKELTIVNASLQAEVEMYRSEAALPNFSKMALGQSTDAAATMMEVDDAPDAFLRSGNGVRRTVPYCETSRTVSLMHKSLLQTQVYPSDPAVTLDGIHGIANPLCCALSADDTLLATGGADAHLNICQWGAALAPTPGAADRVVENAARIACPAPVICAAFSQHSAGKALPVVAAG